MNHAANHRERSRPTLAPPMMVDNEASLARLRRDLDGIRQVAIDTESNSLFAYQEQVCLIQLTANGADYLLDPIRLDRPGQLDFLGEIIQDSDIEKILHAAEYDVRCLRRDFDFRFENLFDTSIAMRLLGWEQIGLGNVLEKEFGVKVSKSHQRADWGSRPLSPSMIRYAQLDTHYLPTLRDRLADTLSDRGLYIEAQELFLDVSGVFWEETEFDPDGFWQIKGARDLDQREAAVLKALYLFREDAARDRNVPVFKVLGDSTLIALTQQMPRSIQQLDAIRGIGRSTMNRYSDDILAVIEAALKAPPITRPKRKRRGRRDGPTRRFDALHNWRKQRAAERGIASDLVLTKDIMHEIAVAAPQSLDQLQEVEGLGPWRLNAYGLDILKVLSTVDG